MEGHFSTGQSPQWAVVPMLEEEQVCEKHLNVMLCSDEEARFVSDHSEDKLCVLKEFSVFFVSIGTLGYLEGD